MRAPAIVRRHPEVVWLATAGVVVALVIAGVSSISGAFRDTATLPATSPEQLVDELRATHVGGYSGTITTDLRHLGLPRTLDRAVARSVPLGGALLHGTHTLRYWYGDAQRQRVAIVGQTGEQDVFRNGASVLYWNTYTGTAVHTTTAARDRSAFPLSLATPVALTPSQLAARMIGMADRSADISLRSGPAVAGRPTYELVLRPDTGTSRIAEVHVQVDGEQAVPLGVQVFARGAEKESLDVHFTSVSFEAPPARNFTFVAPTEPVDGAPTTADTFATDPSDVSVVGTGWLAVSAYRSAAARATPLVVQRVLGPTQRRVSGSWGSGRVLETALLCVLVTSTGRVLAGPVDPSVLYRSLG